MRKKCRVKFSSLKSGIYERLEKLARSLPSNGGKSIPFSVADAAKVGLTDDDLEWLDFKGYVQLSLLGAEKRNDDNIYSIVRGSAIIKSK